MNTNNNPKENELLLALEMTLDCWNRMQSSGIEQAEEAANAFESQFYRFIDELSAWFKALPRKPSTLEEALNLQPLPLLAGRLPAPLLLNFETELELMVDGIERVDDEKYD
jgi:hypothetical protein